MEARSAKSFQKTKGRSETNRTDLLRSNSISASTSVVTEGQACLKCRIAAGSYKGAVGLFLQILGHLIVVLKRRKGLRRPRLQLSIFTAFSVTLEEIHGIFVSVHLVVEILFLELGA